MEITTTKPEKKLPVMNWTGERFTPGSVEGEIEVEHWHRYALAREFVAGKDVLDIASGEGYGSNYLASVARHVTGVDVSSEAIAFARKKYTKTNLIFEKGSCEKIPVPERSFDVVTSFETIEHHPFHDEMMSEVKRILRPGGLLIISSPDKRNYSDIPKIKNEFHLKELYRAEFEQLLKAHFSNVVLLGQKVFTGSLISAGSAAMLREGYSLSQYQELRTGPTERDWIEDSMYHIGVASDGEMPRVAVSSCESDWLRRFYEKKLSDEQTSRRQLESLLVEHTKYIEGLRSEYEQMLNSRSWKITQPLRSIAHLLRNR